MNQTSPRTPISDSKAVIEGYGREAQSSTPRIHYTEAKKGKPKVTLLIRREIVKRSNTFKFIPIAGKENCITRERQSTAIKVTAETICKGYLVKHRLQLRCRNTIVDLPLANSNPTSIPCGDCLSAYPISHSESQEVDGPHLRPQLCI